MKRENWRVKLKEVTKKRIENDQKILNYSERNFSEVKKRTEQHSITPVTLISKSMNERDLIRIYGTSVKNKKINVIISAFDCVDYIEECLNSINNQTYKCNKIFLGIDGCEKTLQKVKEIRNQYSNLNVYYAENNEGPYLMFNSLIELIPDDEYIQIFGADDVMNPNMLEEMSKYDIPVISRNDGILFIKKELFKKIGGFRDWKCAADSDSIHRLKLVINVIRAPKYFFARQHNKQLTKQTATNFNSELRKIYNKISEENRNSQNPVIYITPVLNTINKIENETSNNSTIKI
jgi:glycosyltransferase involved in cell wall biosynthesis